MASESHALPVVSKPENILLTETQAAQRLLLSVRTLQGWRLTGGGPAFIKAGRAVRYRASDIEHWIEGRRRLSTSDPGGCRRSSTRGNDGAEDAPVGDS
jgi:predicted DNA-binding transcriptional regulator AlpA